MTIGGGSAMDTAKAIGVIITNPEVADVRSLEGVAPTKNHAVFTIAVPTTAGTAAEVPITYVITDVEKVRKFVCVDTNDAPEVAVVDPEMMATMPAGLTASTGMDAPCPPPLAPRPRSPSPTSSPTSRRSASSSASTPTTLPRSPWSTPR